MTPRDESGDDIHSAFDREMALERYEQAAAVLDSQISELTTRIYDVTGEQDDSVLADRAERDRLFDISQNLTPNDEGVIASILR